MLIVLGCVPYAAAADYPRDLTQWREVALPPKSSKGDRDVWESAANQANIEWRTFKEAGRPVAELKSGRGAKRADQPSFLTRVDKFGRADTFVEVDDGWLIGFNRGGLGAGLSWFSRNGARNYKVSDHQVAGFFQRADGLHAVEGPGHVGASSGSILRLVREPKTSLWQAQTLARLPGTPEAVSLRSDGTMLVTLSNALVSMDAGGKLRTLLTDAPWPNLYPNSSTLSADERHLYIGMRQYVVDVDLSTRRLRLLIPSRDLLNKLSREDERRVRGYMMFRVSRPG